MVIRMMVEYEILDDDHYTYIENIEYDIDSIFPQYCIYFARIKIIRDLIRRKLFIKKIKQLKVEILKK